MTTPVFIFAVTDDNGDARTMVRSASTWLTAWEVISRRLRDAQFGKRAPVARFWHENTITVYDRNFAVITKGSKLDLDKKLCFDATGKTEIKFG